jgi:hypothetical protein
MAQLEKKKKTSSKRGRLPYLENMKRLKLDILALIPEQVHHDLEVVLGRNVASHNVEVCPIQQDFAQKLERLAFGDVV